MAVIVDLFFWSRVSFQQVWALCMRACVAVIYFSLWTFWQCLSCYLLTKVSLWLYLQTGWQCFLPYYTRVQWVWWSDLNQTRRPLFSPDLDSPGNLWTAFIYHHTKCDAFSPETCQGTTATWAIKRAAHAHTHTQIHICSECNRCVQCYTHTTFESSFSVASLS